MIKRIVFGAYEDSSGITYTFSTPTTEFESNDFQRFSEILSNYIKNPNPDKYLGANLFFQFLSEFESENGHFTKPQRKSIEEIIRKQNEANGHK